MRNISQYPITKQEVLKIIDDTVAGYDHSLCGDIRPYAMRRLKEFLEHNMPETFEEPLNLRN